MKTASLVLGILVFIGMFFALIPLLGWMNWGVIPGAIAGLVISIVALAMEEEKKGAAIVGLVLCAIVIPVAVLRLLLGGGII